MRRISMKKNVFEENHTKEPFKIKLLDLHPSQLYINEVKLRNIEKLANQMGVNRLGPQSALY